MPDHSATRGMIEGPNIGAALRRRALRESPGLGIVRRTKETAMRYLLSIPAIVVVFAAYVLMGQGGGLMLDADAYTVQLASGAAMTLRVGDFFTLAGLVALFFEMLKAARVGSAPIVDHMLSTVVLVAAIVCYLLVDYCGTASFFLLTVMALIDVVAGYSISIFAARRDYSVSRDGTGL
jgi:hypothetical protein